MVEFEEEGCEGESLFLTPGVPSATGEFLKWNLGSNSEGWRDSRFRKQPTC